ncbi:MAG: orotidine-5'-phosphate decarboxylase [Oscillospiraceae bacterium]|nr:orotidine-5'-phosphate decarboxylase [Oscillospiraceae bacterium]
MNQDMLITKIITGKAPCSVVLDVPEAEIPCDFKEKFNDAQVAVSAFCKTVIDSVCDNVAAVSVKTPVFSRYGTEFLSEIFSYAKGKGLYTIADAKCSGDPVSAKEEATFFLETLDADAITLSPYLGVESLYPFFEKCEDLGKSAFIVSHSEEGAPRDVQELMAGMRMVYRAVCEKVSLRGEKRTGQNGYSDIGIMIGGVSNKILQELRRTYKKTFFLLTGYDGNKVSAHDLNGAFDIRGLGGLVCVSRAITMPPGDGELSERIKLATEEMSKDLKLCF